MSNKIKLKAVTPFCRVLLEEKIRMEITIDAIVNETRTEYYGKGDGSITITVKQSRGTTFKLTVGATSVTTANKTITINGLGERDYHGGGWRESIHSLTYDCTIQEVGIPNLPAYTFTLLITGPENSGGPPYVTYNGQVYYPSTTSIPLGVIQIN